MKPASILHVIKATEFLLAARRGAPKQAALPADAGLQSETEAWAVQDLMFTYLATHPVGWKVAASDAEHGHAAPLMARDVLDSPAGMPAAAARTAGTRQFGIEPEVCFRLGADLYPLPPGQQHTRASVQMAIASAHAAIEVCVCRFVDFNAAPVLDRLADNLMNEGLIVGPACSGWRQLDLPGIALRVDIDGATVHSAHGGHPLGDPLIPLVWLANHLSRRHITLRAGSYVTTGSYNGLRNVAAGGRCVVEFTGLGSASVTF